MTDETENLVLEHLRAIRAEQGKHGQLLVDASLRLAAIEQHRAGFQFSEVRQNSEIDRLRERIERIERIERRLELADDQ